MRKSFRHQQLVFPVSLTKNSKEILVFCKIKSSSLLFKIFDNFSTHKDGPGIRVEIQKGWVATSYMTNVLIIYG